MPCTRGASAICPSIIPAGHQPTGGNPDIRGRSTGDELLLRVDDVAAPTSSSYLLHHFGEVQVFVPVDDLFGIAKAIGPVRSLWLFQKDRQPERKPGLRQNDGAGS